MKRFLIPLALLATLLTYAETVTYHVNGKNSVRTEGNALTTVSPQYSQTSTSAQAGQITMGNCAYFSLPQLPTTIITEIVLTMHSNASAGGGSLKVKQNGILVCKIDDSSFASSQWYGEYTSSNVQIRVPLAERLFVKNGDSLSIDICASQNSLYIVSYYISCHAANTEPFSVSLSTGNGDSEMLTESAPNEGVLLPVPDTQFEGYSFVGWTYAVVSAQDSCPQYIPAGSRFFPVYNITLHALYTDGKAENAQWLQATEFPSGDYLVASTYKHCLAVGGLNNDRKIDALLLPPWQFTKDSLRYLTGADFTEESVYHIDFLSDSLAVITNVASNEIIGFSSSPSLSLTHKTDPWNYRVYDDRQICFYHDYGTSTRYLWATEGETLPTMDILTFAAQSYIYSGYANLLFNTDDAPKDVVSTYTSVPAVTAAEQIERNSLRIVHGVILNPEAQMLSLYTLQGTLLLTSDVDISLEGLPCGVYLLKTDMYVQKILVR
ncbi:MAG: hypothetical protein IJ650_04350 [Paludibacteraceae bacterium]|nr:hypothetical protein [Paludibacteraceae bacterium]